MPAPTSTLNFHVPGSKPTSCCKHWHPSSLLLSLLVLGSFVLCPQSVGQQTSQNNSQGRQLSLADQLRYGLKAKTKADKGFLAVVVKAVEEKRLPRTLVDSTFLWARQRAKRRSKNRELRPILYFQPALVLRSKKLGLKLPVIYRFPPVAALHSAN
jgi:hypothetical protein